MESRHITRKNLVEGFISRIVAEHPEPSRKGVAKGNPIGFPKVKVEAALQMALTQKTEREIANELGISESTLRTWYTQKNFKDLMHEQVWKFRKYFLEEMRREASVLEVEGSKRAELAPGEITSPAVESAILDEVEEQILQEKTSVKEAATLRIAAWKKAKMESKPGKRWLLNREPHTQAYVLYALRSNLPGAKPGGPLDEALWLLRESFYTEAEKLLSHSDMSESNRKRALELLEVLRASEIPTYKV